jgi:hypothetical protein
MPVSSIPSRESWRRLLTLFSDDRHVAVEAAWDVYQNLIIGYREQGRANGKALMQAEINARREGDQKALVAIKKLGGHRTVGPRTCSHSWTIFGY